MKPRILLQKVVTKVRFLCSTNPQIFMNMAVPLAADCTTCLCGFTKLIGFPLHQHTSYSLFTLGKPRSPLKINGEQGFLSVKRHRTPNTAWGVIKVGNFLCSTRFLTTEQCEIWDEHSKFLLKLQKPPQLGPEGCITLVRTLRSQALLGCPHLQMGIKAGCLVQNSQKYTHI